MIPYGFVWPFTLVVFAGLLIFWTATAIVAKEPQRKKREGSS